ncbi:MAG: lipid kinase YegS [Idiomarinaceae bacterium HL-53]|nr:MAG: lipid kinase YegS [Idiomarinaceae bacterium HL-53]CUS48880.1 lipid kinase, YegS/Rv2252/BmrU family [Idiomarinaceae bacterium HL-53]
MRTLIIYNPTKQRKRARIVRLLGDTLHTKHHDAVWFPTEQELEVSQARFSAIPKDFEQVIVVGGDGTLHQAVNLLSGFQGEIGYIPAGTGNDFARYWFCNARQHELIEIALEGTAELCDVGRVNDRNFINSVGVGFDGALMYRISQRKSWIPALTYFLAAVQELLIYKATPFEASTEGETFDLRACLLFVIANAPYYGAGMKIAPHANSQDRKLSYICVENDSIVEKFKAFASIFSGKHLQKRLVTYGHLKKIQIKTSGLPMQADGEWAGVTPAEIALAAEQLKIRRYWKLG